MISESFAGSKRFGARGPTGRIAGRYSELGPPRVAVATGALRWRQTLVFVLAGGADKLQLVGAQ